MDRADKAYKLVRKRRERGGKRKEGREDLGHGREPRGGIRLRHLQGSFPAGETSKLSCTA